MALRFITRRNACIMPTYLQRLLRTSTSNFRNDKTVECDEEDNKPIKYTGTPASTWQAKYSRMGNMDTRLWYEPYVILASLSVFLIYFCILREENDVDIEINKSVYQRIPGLEEHQLRVLLEYNKNHNLETNDIIERLQELETKRTI